MTISRRTLLVRGFGATATSLVAGRSAYGAPWHGLQPRLLASDPTLPAASTVDLSIPTILKRISVERSADRYSLKVRSSRLEILPGFQATVWGYDGLFPGPTFETRVGRPISLTLRNELPVPIAHHLQDAHASPESDGYSTDRRAHGQMSQVMRFDISRQSKPSGAVPTFLSDVRPLEISGVSRIRDFHFSYRSRDGWLINNRPFDPERKDADLAFGSTELCRISSDAEHPVHLHGVHCQVADSGWHGHHQAEVSWEDTVALSGDQRLELLIEAVMFFTATTSNTKTWP
jgi:FtsP/CotA-like multicopper oxidase with cupredoxin domain